MIMVSVRDEWKQARTQGGINSNVNTHPRPWPLSLCPLTMTASSVVTHSLLAAFTGRGVAFSIWENSDGISADRSSSVMIMSRCRL